MHTDRLRKVDDERVRPFGEIKFEEFLILVKVIRVSKYFLDHVKIKIFPIHVLMPANDCYNRKFVCL